jgi:uncharacterized protein (DUF58 family)
MLRHVSKSVVLALALVALASSAFAGGKAYIHVSELSKSIVAGEPVPVVFTVQNALHQPLGNLKPVVVATRGDLRVAATAAGSPGGYTASLTLPEAGEWTLRGHPGGNTCVMKGVKVSAAKS